MDSWPPAVLLAAKQDVMRQAFRDMLRRSGVRSVEYRASCGEAQDLLRKEGAKRWPVVILDAAFPDVLETVKEMREMVGGFPKVVLICSGPTREEILEAVRAGVSDFFTYPVSQATIEKKLRRFMGMEKDAKANGGPGDAAFAVRHGS